MTYEEQQSVQRMNGLLSSLPRKEFYLVEDLAEFFDVTTVTIQRHAKNHGIGKITKRSRGGRGVYVFKMRLREDGKTHLPTCDIRKMFIAINRGKI